MQASQRACHLSCPPEQGLGAGGGGADRTDYWGGVSRGWVGGGDAVRCLWGVGGGVLLG